VELELREIEITRQTRINDVLWMPGPNRPRLPRHLCEEIIARGDAVPVGPEWDEPEQQTPAPNKKRATKRNALGGIDRQQEAGNTRGPQTETSLAPGSPGVG